jgi:hypothetical protein
MHASSPRRREVFFSLALTAAAVAVAHPSVRWTSPAPPAAAAYLAPQRAAGPALASRPSFVPVPSVSITDDVVAAQPIPSPRLPAQPAAPSPAPSITPYPSYSGPPPAQPREADYGSVQDYAESLVGAAQFACLEPLWARESGWNPYAENPSSGAYGIPQALPGSKMASAGPDWATNPDTQVRWGVSYVDAIYGSPCAAWEHEEADGWYLPAALAPGSLPAVPQRTYVPCVPTMRP